MKKHILLSITLTFLFVALYAQVTTSSISGIVTDENKEALAGTTVVAVHTPTGTKYGTVTQFSGKYIIRNMKVGGPYTITFSFVGYQDKSFDNIFLQLGQTFNLDAELKSTSEELDAVVIQVKKDNTFSSGRTGSETSLGSKELRTLPTISRSASDFYRLDPTASNGSFGGRNDQFNNFTLDGSIFNNPFGLDAATPGGQTDAQPISLDAIEQIQVSNAPYDVSLSGFTGATINAVTKSGTNKFHGTVYGFLRNQNLTGSKIKGEKIFVPKLEQKQYGFSIGGPIIKNKIFFFVNFEKEDRVDLGSNWIPNNGDGNIGINEATVLESDMIAVQNALASLGYNTGAYKDFTHNSGSNKGIIKLDFNLNDNHKLAVIYNFLDAFKEKPAHPTALGFRGPSTTTLQFEKSGYRMNNNIQSFLVELNSNFTEKISNKFQAGYTYFDDYRDPFSKPAPVINIQNGANSNYIIAGHEPFSINNRLDQKVLQFSDNLNIFLDKHNLTFGFSFEKFMFKNSFNLVAYDNFGTFVSHGNYYGNFNAYPDVATFLADAADPNGLLAANLAYAQSQYNSMNNAGAGNDSGWKLAELNVGQLSLYAQDEFSINNKFKLTYGLRLDRPLYFNTSDLIQKYIDTDNGASRDETIDYFDPETGNAVKLKSTTLPTNKPILSPRLGFNWDAKGDRTLQLRGGTGIFTGRFPFVWLGNQVSGADDGFFQIVDPDFKWPKVWKTSFGIDNKFKNGFVGTFDFAYTKDIFAAHVQNWNLKAPTGTLNGVDNRAIYNATDLGTNNAYVFTNSKKGYALTTTFKIEKSFKNNLYSSFAYNYLNAQSVNSIEAEITGDAFAFNPIVGDANKDVLTPSKYGDKHRIIGVISKKWNYGNDKWATTISSFYEYAQGGRFSYTYAGDINNDGSEVNDLIYIPTESEIASMPFSGVGQSTAFNDFIKQDDYLNENRGKYAERYGALSPWRGKWDMKILQEYKLKDSKSVQLSIDILNLGNLINSDWGVVQIPTSVQPISVAVDSLGNPTYTFNGNIQETFVYDTSLLSRWQMQFGLRFIF